MSHIDTVLAVLRQAPTPLASHQIYELPDCEGMTRAQISSAVGHLRQQGKIQVGPHKVAGPRHGPLQVPTYIAVPEAGVDAALIAALAASVAPPPAATAVKRTGTATRPAAEHPWQRPFTHSQPTAVADVLPDPDGAAQEADFIAADALASQEAAPPLATHLDTALDTLLPIDLAEIPMTDTPARYTPDGHVVQDEPSAAVALAHPEPEPPAWVADLQAWLGPLPADVDLDKFSARFLVTIGPGKLKMAVTDEGGGPFVILDADHLLLNPGELGQVDRYSRALAWIFEAIGANAVLEQEPSAPRAAKADHTDTPATWEPKDPDQDWHFAKL